MQRTGEGSAFLTAMQQGMFAVDTASAGQMMMSIRQILEKLNERLARIHLLKEKARLGDLSEAQAIAGLNVLVASGGDELSLEFVLHRFAERLKEAHQALEIGMRNYAEIEAQAEQDYRRIGHG
jgi:hypothetical protein